MVASSLFSLNDRYSHAEMNSQRKWFVKRSRLKYLYTMLSGALKEESTLYLRFLEAPSPPLHPLTVCLLQCLFGAALYMKEESTLKEESTHPPVKEESTRGKETQAAVQLLEVFGVLVNDSRCLKFDSPSKIGSWAMDNDMPSNS